MGQKLSNNGNALLTGNISAVDTTLTIQSGKADSFPVAGTSDWLAPSDWFRATIEDASGNIEIIKVGTRASGSGVFSVILRGQEGTTPFAFSAGAVVEQRLTKLDVETVLAGSFKNVESAGDLTVAKKITQNGIEGRITPVGGIILYSGAIASIPAGWQLCDGTNGTPNLRDRFVMGAGTAYAVGATGGSKDAVAVAHTHSVSGTAVSGGSHTHGVNDPGHRHDSGTGSVSFQSTGTVYTPGSGSFGAFSPTGISIADGGAHTHDVSGNAASAGVSGTDKNLPPYYALAYIMCLPY